MTQERAPGAPAVPSRPPGQLPGRGEFSLAVIAALASIWPGLTGAPAWSVAVLLTVAALLGAAGWRARRRALGSNGTWAPRVARADRPGRATRADRPERAARHRAR